MPRRRSVKGTVGAGIGAGLSSIGQQLQGIATKRMENDLIMERQRELSKLNQTEALARGEEERKGRIAEAVLKDPFLARRLQQSELADILGLSIPGPTSEDILTPMGEELSQAKTEAEVDTPEGMINRLRGQGGIISSTPVKGQIQVPPMGIAQLLAARSAKQAKFTGMEEAKPVRGKRMTPTGVEEEYFTTQGDVQGKTYPTERTTPQKASQAGAVSRAQAFATQSEEWDPRIVAKKLAFERDKATLTAAVEGDKQAAKAAQEAASSSATALVALNQIKDLYDQVKLGEGPVRTIQRGARAVGRKTGLQSTLASDTVVMLDQLAEGYMMLLYRAFGGTGQAVSDTDLRMMAGLVPMSSTLDTVGDEIFHNSSTALTYNPMIKARYGNKPFELQMRVVQEWLKKDKQAREVEATQFEDPFSPGKFVPVAQ